MVRLKHPDVTVVNADFLECTPEKYGALALGQYDRIVMNPPFDMGADIKHVEHAYEFLATGGRLVAIVANGPRQREELQGIATAWIDLPDDTFKEQGTSVRAAIVVLDK